MLKTLREEMGFGGAIKGEAPMSRHIPYTRHVADTVVRLQNGALMSVIRLSGLFFQTEDQAEINLRANVQNTLLRALGSSRFSVWSTVVRREIKPTLPTILTIRSVANSTHVTRRGLARSACSPMSFS